MMRKMGGVCEGIKVLIGEIKSDKIFMGDYTASLSGNVSQPNISTLHRF